MIEKLQQLFSWKDPHVPYICKAFFEQLDSHLNNFHQLKRQSGQMNKAIEKLAILTKLFLRKYFSKTNSAVASSDDEFDPWHTTTSKPLSNVVPSESIKKEPEKKNKRYSKKNMIPRKSPNKCLNLAHLNLDWEGFFKNLLLKCKSK